MLAKPQRENREVAIRRAKVKGVYTFITPKFGSTICKVVGHVKALFKFMNMSMKTKTFP